MRALAVVLFLCMLWSITHDPNSVLYNAHISRPNTTASSTPLPDAVNETSFSTSATLPTKIVSSTQIDLSGSDSCSRNVLVGIKYGQLNGRNVVIPPGATWSFVAAMGVPSSTPYEYCAGILAGNLCNFAARYAYVAKELGLQVRFQDHFPGDDTTDLGGGPENQVAILFEDDGTPIQDLEITNTTDRPVLFRIEDGRVVGEW